MATWEDIDAYLKGRGVRIDSPSVGATVGGVHTQGSRHYLGRARDYGCSGSDCEAIWAALLPFAQGEHHQLEELFFDPKGGWDNGQDIGPIGGHGGHVHAALREGGSLSNPDPFPETTEIFGWRPPSLNVDLPNPLGAVGDVAGALGSIGGAVGAVWRFAADRGRYMLLLLAGVAMVVLGLVWLGRDLGVEILPAAKMAGKLKGA